MSKVPPTPKKQSGISRINKVPASDKDSNFNLKLSQHQHATTFVTWYRNMLDNERQNFSLYLSDDATLEWFGRTIKTRRKISAFLNHGMQCSKHDFTSVEVIDKIQPRQERPQRKDDSILASPLHSPEVIRSKSGKRKHSLLNCSPEWAEGCRPDEGNGGKRFKTNHTQLSIESICKHENNDENRILEGKEISNNGDGAKEAGKCVLVTPPNVEIGQGDCHPSTSGTDSDRSHETLNSQLPKLAVQCNGYIEFTRTRNSRSIDSMKWERKCKVQISYSDDPLNVGEYIIWAVRYHDENKCRRNLLDAFEKVAKEENF
ncbi:uncharacterized protein [Epargyreus clarus]|uniref:uncharacterized protein n=1 Tax=Epargyreus clarus TaxID=520877 RepID=UPI003C2AD6C8